MSSGIPSAVVELRRIQKQYGSVQALKGIDLTIHAGETVALLGPNGAGKTTAISIMLGLRVPQQGEVSVFGKGPRSADARKRVGAMLQESGVPMALRVGEIIELFRRMYPEPLQTEHVIKLVDLQAKKDARIATLSGGQRQRLYFALAIVGNPDLLFLDEPTVGMDVESRQTFWNLMRQLVAAGRTIVLTTHNLDEADTLAHRVIVIDQGLIVAEGTPAQIKGRIGDKHIRFHSQAISQQDLLAFEDIKQIRQWDDFFDISTEQPEQTFTHLRQLGLTLNDVEIANSKLEDAFLTITGRNGSQSVVR
jgi:ABC-2 type transport system ATP-binding protein